MDSNKMADTQLNKVVSKSAGSAAPISQVTFYTICNSTYFPGLVGLVNSLRLIGHQEPIVVLDCGLTSKQKDILSSHCTLFESPGDLVQNPTQYKPFPYLLNPEGIVVIIDSDIIVTKSLNHIFTSANEGKICVFPDPENDRYFSEWQYLFELITPLRKQTYVNAGFIAFSTYHHPELLKQWWHACKKTFSQPTLQEGASNNHPLSQADQDALNAILMSQYSLDDLALQPYKEEVFGDFKKTKILDRKSLLCQYLDHTPALLHACMKPKPWEQKSWQVDFRSAYTHLLRRLIASSDLPLQVHNFSLPAWLRPGIGNWLITNLFNQLNFLRSFRERLALGTRLPKFLKSLN